MSNIQEMVDQFNNIKRRMQEEGKRGLAEHIKAKLSKVPQVTGIRWTQYTPYFNDGEPCEFSVNGRDFKVDGASSDSAAWCSGFDDDWVRPTYRESDRDASAHACYALNKSLEEVPDDFYRLAFGDHVEVTMERGDDGEWTVSVDEYEHE